MKAKELQQFHVPKKNWNKTRLPNTSLSSTGGEKLRLNPQYSTHARTNINFIFISLIRKDFLKDH